MRTLEVRSCPVTADKSSAAFMARSKLSPVTAPKVSMTEEASSTASLVKSVFSAVSVAKPAIWSADRPAAPPVAFDDRAQTCIGQFRFSGVLERGFQTFGRRHANGGANDE